MATVTSQGQQMVVSGDLAMSLQPRYNVVGVVGRVTWREEKRQDGSAYSVHSFALRTLGSVMRIQDERVNVSAPPTEGAMVRVQGDIVVTSGGKGLHDKVTFAARSVEVLG